MCAKDTENSYGGVSKLNHWLIGLLIIGMLASGLIIEDMPKGPEKFALLGLHKSFGFTVLVLASWRILWRLRMGFPKAAEGMQKWEVAAGHAVHGFLMLFGVIMPVAGLLMGAAAGYPTAVFGLFTIPAFAEKNALIGTIAGFTHSVGGKLFIALIILHILAGLKHHFINKDNTLRRMIGRG